MYPYKIQRLHALKEEDYGRREEFAEIMLHRANADPDYLRRVCFSDESTFHTSAVWRVLSSKWTVGLSESLIRELMLSAIVKPRIENRLFRNMRFGHDSSRQNRLFKSQVYEKYDKVIGRKIKL